MDSVKIHIPLKSGGYTEVYVSSKKMYGNKLGSELINLYGKKPKRFKNKAKSQIELLKRDTIIRLPSGELPRMIKIGTRYYDTRKFLNVIEEVTGKKIISKRENRPLKHMQNVSIRIPVKLNDYFFDPLEIIAKDNIYQLTPSFFE